MKGAHRVFERDIHVHEAHYAQDKRSDLPSVESTKQQEETKRKAQETVEKMVRKGLCVFREKRTHLKTQRSTMILGSCDLIRVDAQISHTAEGTPTQGSTPA